MLSDVTQYEWMWRHVCLHPYSLKWTQCAKKQLHLTEQIDRLKSVKRIFTHHWAYRNQSFSPSIWKQKSKQRHKTILHVAGSDLTDNVVFCLSYLGKTCAKITHSTMQADWESDWVSLKYLLCCTFGFLSKPAGVLWDSWPVQKWSIFPNSLDICHKPWPGKCHSIILAQNISIIILPFPEMCVSAVRTECHHPFISLKCCYVINIPIMNVRMFLVFLACVIVVIWFVYLFENWYVCLSNAHS